MYDGEDAQVSVGTVATLEPGEQATVSNSGTEGHAVLDFGIPKGDPGDVQEVKAAEGSQIDVSTDAGVVTVDDSALRSRIEELEHQSANVVTGTSTGYVSHGEDAYAQKPKEVRIKGKTVKNLWQPISGTRNGITVSTDETGLITVTGTATSYVRIASELTGVAENSSITIAASTTTTTTTTYSAIVLKDDSTPVVDASNSNKTGNVGEFEKLECAIYVANGQTVNTSFRVMLVEGSEAPDCFVPTGLHSVEPTKLVTAGKNLADITESDSNQNFILYANKLPPGTYAFSCDKGADSGYVFNIKAGNYLNAPDIVPAVTSPVTFTVKHSTPIFINGWGLDGSYVIGDIQLELGSTATAYEPPNITTTPLPEVELHSLPNGTCDELVIKSDGTATVERRTQLSDGEVTELPEPATEPKSPVTLPTLPAPTFNAYHDSQVPSDTSMEYARDINIVLANLEAVQTALLGGE